MIGSARGALGLALGMLAALIPATVVGQERAPRAPGERTTLSQEELMKQVRLEQKLKAQLPLDAAFRDEKGQPVQLFQYFGKKPVVLILIQYRCTMLCSEEMNALAASLKELKFTVGKEFDLVTLTIDPRETHELAAQFEQGYVKEYGRPGSESGWHFLTGDKASIQRVADAVGFHYVYDARTDQFAHPDGVIILTPEGKVARYFFRLEYPARDMRLALVEASAGKIGTLMDGFALLCYHYNPVTGKYSLTFMGVLRMAAMATVLVLGTAVVVMSLRGGHARRGRSMAAGRGQRV